MKKYLLAPVFALALASAACEEDNLPSMSDTTTSSEHTTVLPSAETSGETTPSAPPQDAATLTEQAQPEPTPETEPAPEPTSERIEPPTTAQPTLTFECWDGSWATGPENCLPEPGADDEAPYDCMKAGVTVDERYCG